MRFPALLICLMAFGLALRAAPASDDPVEAILVVTADQHSAYERTAQFVGLVDKLKTDHPGVPVAVLIDGDTFELGNAVAKRSGGAIEFAMFASLAQRAPTVLNLGNHEPEFYDLAATVARVRATGVTVIGGNAIDRTTGKPFAPASTVLSLPAPPELPTKDFGARFERQPARAEAPRHLELTLVGLTTDRLATYRAAVRPSLDLADPVVWAKANLPSLLAGAAIPVVMSHAGLKADRAILPLVPDGTLYVGAHDHLRLVQADTHAVYFHSGSWNEYASIARLRRSNESGRYYWNVEQVRLETAAPADPTLAALIHETFARDLLPEDQAVVGHLAKALPPEAAARFAVEAVRQAAGADVAIVGATTFGGGLPAGDVTRFALDGCVRFDGTIFVAVIDGARLQQILARCNQGPDTPFNARTGENLIATTAGEIVAGRTYRVATTDWLAKNPSAYFGPGELTFAPRPELHLKAVVAGALVR